MIRVRILLPVMILAALAASVVWIHVSMLDGDPLLDSRVPAARARITPETRVNHASQTEDACAFTVVSAYRDIPIAGASVIVQLKDRKAVTCSTDTQGQVHLQSCGATGFSIHVEAKGFHPQEYMVDGDFADPRTIRLKPAAIIHGRVVDSLGTPAVGAQIQIGVVMQDASGVILGEPWPISSPLVTGEEGGFSIKDLDPRGHYLLVASLSKRFVGVVREVSAIGKPVVIRFGDTASILVEVVDRAGQWVPGAQAVLEGRPLACCAASITTDLGRAEARIVASFDLKFTETRNSPARIRNISCRHRFKGFAFDGLPAGQYVLHVEADGFKRHSKKISVGRFDRIQRKVVLESEAVTLTGRVTDSYGQSIPDARLTVLSDGRQLSGYGSSSTGHNGTFRMRGPGSWTEPLPLRVVAVGFEKTTIHVPPGKKRIAVTLRKNGRLRGQVRLGRKGPADVSFTFSRSHPEPLCEKAVLRVRNRSKRFSFALCPGTWTLTVTTSGHQSESRLIDIFEGCEMPGLLLHLRAE